MKYYAYHSMHDIIDMSKSINDTAYCTNNERRKEEPTKA
jgi:hypothetical protein